jgi:hypothetical protein
LSTPFLDTREGAKLKNWGEAPESLGAGIEVLDKVRKKVSTNLAQSDEKQEVSNV